MSGHEGRSKGKRVRRPQNGNSNSKARWKYLSTDVSDEVEAAKSRPARAKQPHDDGALSKADSVGADCRRDAGNQRGYDIDGDGVVDVREMRLAKFLDAMMVQRRVGAPSSLQQPEAEPSEAELLGMRQRAGRLLMAKEFVERNHDHLWRYGSIFTGKDDDQSAEFIAGHSNFPKLMGYLENVERQRSIRSSHNIRGCIRENEVHTSNGRQTWVETARKVPNPTATKLPLPALQPKKTLQLREPLEEDDDIAINTYGAIDIDGDGIVDADEMKLHLRLQEGSNSSERQEKQLEGRRMLAQDFVQRNDSRMWLYDAKYKAMTSAEIADDIASSTTFAKDLNKLRAKERVVKLTSSSGVFGCLAQLPSPSSVADPVGGREFRRVHARTELLHARRELQKPLGLQRGVVREDTQQQQQISRAASEGCIGLPHIFDAPRRLDVTGTFSVTKWRLAE